MTSLQIGSSQYVLQNLAAHNNNDAHDGVLHIAIESASASASNYNIQYHLSMKHKLPKAMSTSQDYARHNRFLRPIMWYDFKHIPHCTWNKCLMYLTSHTNPLTLSSTYSIALQPNTDWYHYSMHIGTQRININSGWYHQLHAHRNSTQCYFGRTKWAGASGTTTLLLHAHQYHTTHCSSYSIDLLTWTGVKACLQPKH